MFSSSSFAWLPLLLHSFKFRLLLAAVARHWTFRISVLSSRYWCTDVSRSFFRCTLPKYKIGRGLVVVVSEKDDYLIKEVKLGQGINCFL